MNNLQSKPVQLAANEVIRVAGNADRKVMYFQLDKTKAYSVALAPLGAIDPTPFWVPVEQATGTLTMFEHFGEMFFRNDSGALAGMALASDTPMDVTHNYTP